MLAHYRSHMQRGLILIKQYSSAAPIYTLIPLYFPFNLMMVNIIYKKQDLTPYDPLKQILLLNSKIQNISFKNQYKMQDDL
jgi:hypothetical protein